MKKKVKIKREVKVLSLGGSLIIPNEINLDYLLNLKKILIKHSKNYKFVITCGGGKIARIYIEALKKSKINKLFQSFIGISCTRTNARFMNYLFGLDSDKGIPHTTKSLIKGINKKDIVFCGALEYKPNQTSDSTAALLSKRFKTDFINLTNVKGLYDKDPSKNKNAKLIKEISWTDFDDIVNRMKFKPGQHFVLDQNASKIIKESKIKTFILGSDLKELDNLLNKKNFEGTTIGEFNGTTFY
ncbi:UMP kinase [Candidatus Woesearchaeota archaeon]|jgi:uridylate kinase|nr:UMP kinase [Candidatus Woesearchaeota archaeon]